MRTRMRMRMRMRMRTRSQSQFHISRRKWRWQWFSSLQVWHVGDGLPGGNEYVFTLQSIKRREGANSPDTSLYAVIHAELRKPRETRLLGQVVRSDSDPHDYVLYKGETWRISNALYRVNWISQDEDALAAGVFRNPDNVTAPFKFDYR